MNTAYIALVVFAATDAGDAAAQGKDYTPLVAVIVSGALGALGLVVSILVLRFNIRSQANPARVELLKKQMDLSARLALLGFRVIDDAAVMLFTNGGEAHKKQLDDRQWEFSFAVVEAIPLIPDALTGSLGEFRRELDKLNEVAPGGDVEGKKKLIGEVTDAWNRYVGEFRKVVGTEPLTDSMKKLIGQISVAKSK
jgi:hypothetical protein